MALDHASQSTAAEVWAMIVAANAALYAVVGLLLFGLWAIRKSN